MVQPQGAYTGPIRRQAVVVIHGIGEQRPMETLRSFLAAVLGAANPAAPSYYSKPDTLADGFELRRLVATSDGRRSDYYELYWANLMPIAATDRIIAWYRMLLRRTPGNVPRRFLFLWLLSWLAVLAFVGLVITSLIGLLHGVTPEQPLAPILKEMPWALATVLTSLGVIVRASIGDAAVYLSPEPRNVDARNRIRGAAVRLIEKLHASKRYERIVIVGHSLGSVIGLDALTIAWQRQSDAQRERVAAGTDSKPADGPDTLQHAEELAAAIGRGAAAEGWHAMSTRLLAAQQASGVGWQVTDFVTLGSPLAHGAFLLARSEQDFSNRVTQQELPTAPPFLEGGQWFSYPVRVAATGAVAGRVLHHSACFAMTRWTNLYFPSHGLLHGDPIGGPVAPVFGRGVRDIVVSTGRWWGWLSHVSYWVPRRSRKATLNEHCILKLREVLSWP